MQYRESPGFVRYL